MSAVRYTVTLGNGRKVVVVVSVDEAEIARQLAHKAAQSKGKKARFMKGAVIVNFAGDAS